MNKIIIITAPSGAGKTSITHYLLNELSFLSFSISAATRKPRANEKNGVDYYFLPVEEFKKKINENAFIEWEMVYKGNYYGTLKQEIERIWGEGKTPLLDIDVKGALHVKQQFVNNSLSIFVEPPSVEELKNRLLSRGTETAETLATRVNKAEYEISFKTQFDKIIVNDKLHHACEEAEKAIKEFLEKE